MNHYWNGKPKNHYGRECNHCGISWHAYRRLQRKHGKYECPGWVSTDKLHELIAELRAKEATNERMG